MQMGQNIGPYRIEGVLGSGGMGRVYLAHDTTLKRAVAIKVVDPLRQDADALLREA
jgi:serine/threonine protein kinase